MVLGTAAKSVEVKSKNENIKNVKRHKTFVNVSLKTLTAFGALCSTRMLSPKYETKFSMASDNQCFLSPNAPIRRTGIFSRCRQTL